jgi:hypothetical protein
MGLKPQTEVVASSSGAAVRPPSPHGAGAVAGALIPKIFLILLRFGGESAP